MIDAGVQPQFARHVFHRLARLVRDEIKQLAVGNVSDRYHFLSVASNGEGDCRGSGDRKPVSSTKPGVRATGSLPGVIATWRDW